MRVADHLNATLHAVLDRDENAYFIGEDVLDPYGGAFKIAKGLSTRFPARVLSTPISENAIAGVGAGLALAGDTAIVEMMFGDFVTLAFDQLVNFAAKSVSMYGERVDMRLIVRCPSGGGRGYGPTHSQQLMKHFVGVPGLSVYELSAFHDAATVFDDMLARAEPCLYVEDKVLYTRRMHDVASPFRPELRDGIAWIGCDGPPDCLVIAPGGMADRVLRAMHRLLVEQEIACLLAIPALLHPFHIDAPDVRFIFVVEESTAGGTWGAEVAHVLHQRHWNTLSRPVTLVHSRDSVIPAAPHLERNVLVDEASIYTTIARVVRA